MDRSPKPIDDLVARKRMQMTFDLCEAAELIMKQNLRRRFPAAGDAEIERRLGDWRRRRPGAEHGDGVGRPVPKDEIETWLASRRS